MRMPSGRYLKENSYREALNAGKGQGKRNGLKMYTMMHSLGYIVLGE